MPEETTQPQAQPQLQLNDLVLIAQILQIVGQRGAIRVDEFTQVGAVYDRVMQFLQASGALVPAEQAAAQPDATTDAPVDAVTTQG